MPKSNIIEDKYFNVQLCGYGSSPDPVRAIWWHQHSTVSESIDWLLDREPSRDGMLNAILEQMHQRHWHVLDGAFAKISFEGFNHAAAMQWRTHQDAGTLVQSLRYTGKRFLEKELTDEEIQKFFYCRTGSKEEIEDYRHSVLAYKKAVESGQKMEVARDKLSTGYRQGWSVGCNVTAWLHILDQRLLMDAQDEARCAAEMALIKLEQWSPEIFGWYRINRAGKNLLAP